MGMSACSPEITPALGMQRFERKITSKRKSEASWRHSTRVPTRTMLFMYENVMSPIVAKWWTNMIRKSWKQENHEWRLFGCHMNAKVWNRPNWVTRVTGFFWFRVWFHSKPSSSHSHHLHKSFQKGLSALVLLKSELCLLRDQHSLSGTHTTVPADPIEMIPRTRWPLFLAPCGFTDTLLVPSAPGTHLRAVSDQTLPGQSRHRPPGNSARRTKNVYSVQYSGLVFTSAPGFLYLTLLQWGMSSIC